MINRSIHFPDKTDQNFAEKHFDQAKISVFPASSPAWDVDGKIKGVPAPDPYVVGSVDEFRMAPKGAALQPLIFSLIFNVKLYGIGVHTGFAAGSAIGRMWQRYPTHRAEI